MEFDRESEMSERGEALTQEEVQFAQLIEERENLERRHMRCEKPHWLSHWTLCTINCAESFYSTAVLTAYAGDMAWSIIPNPI